MGSPKGYPKNVNELCDRLRVYFENDLNPWLARRHPESLELKPGEPIGKDPPPKPPDLGP